MTGRLDRLRAAFDEHEIDALVVTTLANVRYLTGFSGSAGILTVTRDWPLLTTDGRYRTQSAEQVERAGAAAQVDIAIGPVAEQRQAAQAVLGAAGQRPHRARGRQRDVERAAQPGPTSSAATRSWPRPTRSRRCASAKDAAEIARMERAAAIADAALFEVLPLMGQGVTEEHFALELDTAMRRGGAESTAFETIVAAGENSAKPHHHPGAPADQRGRPGRGRLRGHLRGLPLRHDAHVLRRRGARGRAGAHLRRRPRRPRPPGPPRCAPASAPRRSTTSAGRSSPTPAGPSASSTAPATASASTSTRPRRCPAGHCYPRPRLRRHRRARRLPPRARRRPRRGHPGRDRGRRPPPDPIHKGHPWQSRPMT